MGLPLHSRSLRQAVGVVVGLTAGFAVLLLGQFISPDDLLVRGELGPSEAVLVHDFGPSDNPGMTGFDGQQTYAIARDFPDVDKASQSLDNPRYRLLRILQPAVASVVPAGSALVVTLLALGIIGCGLATYAVAELSARYGHSTLAGPVVGLSLVSSVAVTAVDALAYGLGLMAALLTDRSRIHGATALFVAASLTRESGVVMAAATAVAIAPRVRWRAVPVALIPAGALLAWYLALGQLVGGELPRRTTFLAFFRTDTGTSIFSIVVLMLCVVAAISWRRAAVLCAIATAFSVWTLFYAEDVLDFGAIGVFRVNAAVAALGVVGLLHSSARVRPLRRPWPVSADRQRHLRGVEVRAL
jgi:hypothetical protein